MAGQVASPEDGFYSPKGSDLGKTNKTLLMTNLHASFYFTIIRLYYLFLHFFFKEDIFPFHLSLPSCVWQLLFDLLIGSDLFHVSAKD